MPYTGDDNGSNTYTIDYKTCASGTWANWVTNAPHSPSPYTAAITGLINNQCYSIRATYFDSDGISGSNPQTIQISAGWDNTLLHNSNRFPGTTKWSGDWGTPTGQYNRIVCETCHTRTTANIKRVKDTVITAPDSPAQRFPAETGGAAPVFQSITAPNGFGDDTGGHASSQKICEVCHSTTSYHRYNTVGQTGLDHNNTTDCIACHPHSLGFKDAAECNSCHGAPPGSGTDTNTPAVFAASHAKHYDAVSGGVPVNYSAVSNRSTATGHVFDCGICHSSNNSNHLANQDGTVDVMLPAGGVYTPGPYVGGDNPSPPGSVTFRNSNGSCSNVYCHGNYPGSGKNATPTWGNTSSAACGTCHGAGNTETTRPASGSHERHVSNSFTIKNPYSYDREYACTLCHRQSVNGTLNNYTISNTSTHPNMLVDTSFDTGDPRLSGASSYSIVSGTQAPSDGISRAYGTCSNVYCHSNVQGLNGVGAPTSYDTVQWGAPKHADPINVNSVVNCLGETSQCHVPAGSSHSYNISTGSHTRHMQYTFGTGGWVRTCGACHKWEPTGISCNNCHVTPGEKTYHVNGTVDILFEQNVTNHPTIVKVGASATYDDNTATPGAPGNGYFSCSNTYCHSDGTSVSSDTIPSNTTVTWGTPGPLVCDSCHTGGTASGPTYSSGSPKANSHNKHVAVKGYTCTDCHSAVVSSGFIINTTKHINASYDVSGGNITTYTFATDGGTCATYCHGPSTPKWGGAVACGDCHASTNETLTTGTHATHLVSVKGPNGVVSTSIYCGKCHGTGAATGTHAGHADGVVTFGDGNLFATTNVCDTCHSPEGLYDGVNDPVIGAKVNWTNGVYLGNALIAGKEKWCATCHDAGTSVIVGRQAPDVVGDEINYGYYRSGHGAKTTECDGCHGLNMNHNFDGKKTYLGASNNYQAGFRLKDTLTVPLASATCNGYNKDNHKLCYNCHSEANLMSDTKDRGCYDCLATPTNFKNAPVIVTNFRNTHPQGHNTGTGINDMPANFHADHLIDVRSFGSFWYSDGPGTGTGTSAVTCTTCHNPHGEKQASSNNPAPRMSRGVFDISYSFDANGDFGQINGSAWYTGGDPNQTCAFACHGAGAKWYYNAVPYIQGITVADNNSADPAAAEANFTNNRTIRVTLTVSGVATEMMFAEDNAFTVNPTVWLPYAASSTYTLTASEGAKRVYARTSNGLGVSNTVQSFQITLDTTPPTVPANALTSPNGTEVWDQGTSHAITWSGITDTYLKAAPVALSYSTDSGSSYPNSIASGEANDGTYPWSLPLINSSTVRVKISATDRAGNQSSDTSNNDFTVRAVTPNITGFTVSDNNNADPAPAEAGYTNSRNVALAITSANYPTEMILAEDSGFTVNSTGWITYATSSTYTLTNSDGAKTVYLKLRNAAGESTSSSFAITLDRVTPAITANTLAAPNGAELWSVGETTRQITWTAADITDVNLKASPVTLTYSADAGGTYPNTITSNIANSGSYPWNPITKPASYQARVRITATDRAGNQATDNSNANFIIKPLYIVTNTNNEGAGSLRQAMLDLNAAGGNDAIWFDIPVGSLTNGVGVIGLITVLPTINVPGVTIDGGSQSVLRGETNTVGGTLMGAPEIRLDANSSSFVGLTSSANNTTIRGMQFTNFWEYGISVGASNAVIEGNHVGFWSDSANNYTTRANRNGMSVSGLSNRIGGTSAEATNYICGNVRSGLDISGGASIINNSIGLLPNGNGLYNGTTWFAIKVGGNNVTSTVQGNRISGSPSSDAIRVTGSTVTIKGNTFGLYYNGSTWAARSAPLYAISSNSTLTANLVIGGPTVATSDAVLNDSNVISAQYGVYISQHDSANPTKVYGNFFGTNPGLSQTFSGTYGVYLNGASASNSSIGGSGAGEAGNVIAHMTTRGVHVNTGANGTKISRNSFFDNGIEAAASDDAIYLAAGANNDITRPVISAASTVSVTVDGVTNGDVVEVYISDYDGDGTEYGEGKTIIGSATAGGASVAVPVSGVSVGQWVTATRTSASDTSAFSANVQVQ